MSLSNGVFLRAFASLRELSRRRKEFQRKGAKKVESREARRVQLNLRAWGIPQRVRTASGSDRILRATQHRLLFRKLLFDPVATARGSDTIRGDSHI